MAVYYKFKSAKDYDSVMIDGHFIAVGVLKEKLFELKQLGRGTDFDLIITNAQTNEEYLDEGMLIPKNTSVLIRRVPGRPRKPIVTAPVTEPQELIVENKSDDIQAVKGSFGGAEPSAMNYAEDLDWDEFGNDLYAIPETTPVQSSIPVQDALPVSKEDEDSKLKALIDTPALDWQRQPSDGFGPGRGYGRGMGGRMTGGRGFGRGGFDRTGFEKKTPPPGYICHRCKIPGHYIQHCPTNGDPTFDVRRMKPPTGIPKSMLMATPDGSYSLPSGAVAVLKPNEAAFEKEIEGMPSTRSVGDLPPELHCPLCKEVMKDAVLTSKCCFTSYCDKCIRDYIISKSKCVCGATNILADDLLPNKTLRDTINRILESNNSSAENGGSAYQVQDMESRNPQAKVPSPAQSAASKGQQVPAPPPQGEETSKIVEAVEEIKPPNVPVEHEKGITAKLPDVSEAAHDSRVVKEAASQGSALLADEEAQKAISGEAGKKKKKKKVRMPPGAAEMQWRNPQELAPDYMMPPMPPSNFNPYWTGMQPGFDGFMPPYGGMQPGFDGFMPPPYWSGMQPGFGGVLPHDPFGGPACMFPYGPGPGPQRDLAELAMGFNHGPPPPFRSREEFEARKANDLQRKREMERRGERETFKDTREYGREGSSRADVSSIKPKSKSSIPPPSSGDYRQQPLRHRSPERHPDLPRPPSNKRRSDYDHDDSDHHHRPSSKKRSSEYDQEDDYAHRPSSKKKSDYHDQEDEYVHRPSSKKRSDYHDQEDDRHNHGHSSHQRRSESPSAAAAAAEKKLKSSVFSRISFPENESRKRKVTSSSSEVAAPAVTSSNGYNHHHEEHKARRSGGSSAIAAASVDHDSSDDDERHFKRRPSRYNSSPPPPEEEGGRHHSRSSRDNRGKHSHR